MELAYLDNNATTRPDPRVVQEMLPFMKDWYANPSSAHRFGQWVRRAVDEARQRVASLIGCSEEEITFTSGGTEAINTAIRSLLAWRAPRLKIVTSSVEHSATRQLCRELAMGGVEIIEIEVDRSGRLDLDQLAEALNDQVALASIMWANNETGVLFPVERVALLCRERNVPFHCDAVQAVGKIPVDVRTAGIDMLSLSGHKFHGPKGVGAVYARRGIRLRPLIIGGPQEYQRRGGTENVPGIVGMGRAAQLAAEFLPRMRQVEARRDRLEQGILRSIPETCVNGCTGARLPNTANIGFAGLQADAILMLLSERGICASAGAACASGSLEPSHVMRAMRVDDRIAHGSVRFSLSRFTTDQEIDHTLRVLPEVIGQLRQVMPAAP